MPERHYSHKFHCCSCFSHKINSNCIEKSLMPDQQRYEEDGYSPLTTQQQQQMGQQELPLELPKLLVVILLLTIAGFSNWITLAIIHDFIPMQPLPDIISAIIPEQTWALRIGDLMVTFAATCMISVFVLHKHRAVVIRRSLFIIAVLYFMRTVSLAATQLPSGYQENLEKCRDQIANKTERTFTVYLIRVLEQSVHFGLQDIEAKMLCGDLLFSGHTLILVISSLTVEYYLPYNLRFCQYVPKFFMMIGVVCLVLSRTHYTIDVIFAYWLSVGVFSVYHSFCEIDTYRERKNSVLYRLWIIRFVGWLEENVVPGKLDNVLEVPLVPKIYNRLRGRTDSTSTGEQPPTISSTSSTIVIDP